MGHRPGGAGLSRHHPERDQGDDGLSEPRQNRVTPLGEIVSDPARGTLMGNRGILHDDQGRLGVARWRHKAWICCELCFKGRKRQLMAPGRYTELFFLDEAVALAAGHRPCAECRRADWLAFRAAFGGGRSAPEIDRILHDERVAGRSRAQLRRPARLANLPAGAMILRGSQPWLVLQEALRPWSMTGYGAPSPRPADEDVCLLTPASSLRALASGFRPRLHPSALDQVASRP